MRPGGGLVVDYNAAAESVLPGYTGEPKTHVAGEIVMAAEQEYDVSGGRMLSRYVFTRGAEKLRATAIHHMYTCAHVTRLLADAGFSEIRCFSGASGESFALGSGRLMVTAHRAP